MLSPTAMSSAPSGVESSHLHNEDPVDEKHQPEISSCNQEKEEDHEPKHVKLELKRYHLNF